MSSKLKRILKEKLKGEIPNDLLDLLPSRYPMIGGAIIIFLQDELKPYKNLIGRAIIESWNLVKSVWVREGPTRGVHREPQLECVAGACDPIVTHRELETTFRIDISKLTFSPGNAGERQKLVRLIREGDIVVDMFACCGNLSLPIAKKSNPKAIFGIEINPYAYSFLIENISLNHVEDRYFPILGDNRIATPEDVADHVLMGYFEVDETQMEVAVKAIKKNGIIHLHFLSKKGREGEKLNKYLRVVEDAGARVIDFKIDKVKSYAPNTIHYVARVQLEKNHLKNK